MLGKMRFKVQPGVLPLLDDASPLCKLAGCLDHLGRAATFERRCGADLIKALEQAEASRPRLSHLCVRRRATQEVQGIAQESTLAAVHR